MSKSPAYMKNEATAITVRHGNGAITLRVGRVTGGVKRWEAFRELTIPEAIDLAGVLTRAAQGAAACRAKFEALDEPREIA